MDQDYNFILKQGSLFTLPIVLQDDDLSLMDLTGYTARMQIRETVDSSSVILSLTSSPAAGITINTDTSTITITITAVQSAAITTPCMVYDLEIIPSTGEDYAERILQGSIKLSKEVTR